MIEPRMRMLSSHISHITRQFVWRDSPVTQQQGFEIWDRSHLRSIDDSGHIDNLYSSAEAAANPAVNVAI